jgi:hypothetical protein|tara:strand:- start:158 stop:643 length:486 start_codon:yes stop_codon:yes gene_type:complete
MMETAQFVARSQRRMTEDEIAAMLGTGVAYAGRVAGPSVQLELLEVDSGSGYGYSGPNELRDSTRSGWTVIFRRQLQDFLPFLYYAFWLRAGDTGQGAARKIRVEFEIRNEANSIARTFFRWAATLRYSAGPPLHLDCLLAIGASSMLASSTECVLRLRKT